MTDRRNKRQRTPPDLPAENTTDSTSPDLHVAFAKWAAEQGIIINSVQPVAIPGRGIGLVATHKIKKNQKLIFVPVKAMIQPSKAVFKCEAGKKLSPQGKLTATLLNLVRTDDDRYSHCQTVWPDVVDFASTLPWYSGMSLEKLPQYTEHFPKVIQGIYDRIMDDMTLDHTTIWSLSSLQDRIKRGDLTKDDFHYHWTLANTRSFSWKPAGKREGAMVVCPFLDYMNHCPSGRGCEVRVTSDGYELIADRKYNVGDEIFATYGAHSNDKLLGHYGFILQEPFDTDDIVSLDEIILPRMTPSQKRSLESVGYLGNYTLSPGTGEICFRTQVALRAMLQTSNEWEFYMTSGEDVGQDADLEMKQHLAALIQEYLPITQSKRLALADMESRPEFLHARDLFSNVIHRWEQIEAALKAYIEK